jgi:hypothetical protein
MDIIVVRQDIADVLKYRIVLMEDDLSWQGPQV